MRIQYAARARVPLNVLKKLKEPGMMRPRLTPPQSRVADVSLIYTRGESKGRISFANTRATFTKKHNGNSYPLLFCSPKKRV